MDNNCFSLMTFPFGLDLFFKRLRIIDLFRLADSFGIPYVDVMNIPEKKVSQYRNAIDATGVAVYCYIASVSFFSHKDKLESRLRNSIKTAKALGARMLMIVPYVGMRDLKSAQKMGKESVQKLLINGFRLATALGAHYAIPVCFEITPHDEICLSGAKDCKLVLDAVPDLGLVFDTANMLPAGDVPVETYDILRSRICHVHLKDVSLSTGRFARKFSEHTHEGRNMHCVVWGEGIIPVNELMEKMKQDGYPGVYAIEYVHPTGLVCGMKKHTDQLCKFTHCIKNSNRTPFL